MSTESDEALTQFLRTRNNLSVPNYFSATADAWLEVMAPAVKALAAECLKVNPKRPDTPFDLH